MKTYTVEELAQHGAAMVKDAIDAGRVNIALGPVRMPPGVSAVEVGKRVMELVTAAHPGRDFKDISDEHLHIHF